LRELPGQDGNQGEVTAPLAPDVPIYLQLYARYRGAITQGKLGPGDRVPSVRSLASELGVARGTVDMAYQMLVNEGYFVARGAAGTVVSPRLGHVAGQARALAQTTAASPSPHRQATGVDVLPFQLGMPALDAFPRKVWGRLAGRAQRTLDMAAMAYPDPAGHLHLRRAIATYLGLSRGIACSWEQVFVTPGYRGALGLIHGALLQGGDLGWHEDPGYVFARQYMERAGLRLVPVPVDEEGLDVDFGRREAGDARFVMVTPTHQSPTGVALSLPRRLALLEWAQQAGAWVIEDDYDSEFRYHGRPLPALKSLDRSGRVLYTGTFSKVLFPGLRLAYLVVPAAQVDAFRDTAEHLPGPGSIVLQSTVAEFMEQGHFGRHLRKMRTLYAARRGYLVEAMERVAGTRLRIRAQAGGIQLLAQLDDCEDDSALAAAARAAGLAVQALSDWRIRPSSDKGLLMGFANLAGAGEAEAAVGRLVRIMSDYRAGKGTQA